MHWLNILTKHSRIVKDLSNKQLPGDIGVITDAHKKLANIQNIDPAKIAKQVEACKK